MTTTFEQAKKNLDAHIQGLEYDCAVLMTYNTKTEKAQHAWSFAHNEQISPYDLHFMAEKMARNAAEMWHEKAENPVLSEMHLGPRKRIVLGTGAEDTHDWVLGAIGIARKDKPRLWLWAEIMTQAFYFGVTWAEGISGPNGKRYWSFRLGIGPLSLRVSADYEL